MRQSAGPQPGLCRRRRAGASALDMLAGDGGAAGPGPPLESGGLRGPRARPQPAGQRPQRGERKAGRPESTDSHPTSSVQRLPFCVTAHPGVTPPAHAVWAPESTPRPQTPRGWGQVGCPTRPRPRPALVPNARASPVRAAAPVSNVPCACLGSRVTGTRRGPVGPPPRLRAPCFLAPCSCPRKPSESWDTDSLVIQTSETQVGPLDTPLTQSLVWQTGPE